MTNLICEEAERHVLSAFCQGKTADLNSEWFGDVAHARLVGVLGEGRPGSQEALLGRLIAAQVPGDMARRQAAFCFKAVEFDLGVLETLRELAVRRRLATVTVDELSRLAQQGGDLELGVREAFASVEVLFSRGVDTPRGLGSLIDWTRRRFEGEQYGYRVTWPLLEGLLGPLARDRLFVLSGRQKVGKSIWALSLALDVAQQGGRCWFNALDMGKERTFLRLVSSLTGLPFTKLWRNELDAAGRQLFEDAAEDIEALDMQIVRVADIQNFARMSKGADLAVVDYLQMATVGRYQSKTEEVTAIVESLKEQAADHFVVAVSQLSRGSDLPLWSGAIEQMADILAQLRKSGQRLVVLDVQYHRDGPVAQIPYYLFVEVERAIELYELLDTEIRVGG